MSIIGTMLILLVGYILYNVNMTDENFTQSVFVPPYKNIYAQHIRELTDVDHVLRRPTEQGNYQIDNIQLLPADYSSVHANVPHITDKGYLGDNSEKPYNENNHDGTYGIIPEWKDPIETCLPQDHPIYDIIKARQPYIFGDKAEVIMKDGEMFYHDWRYPLKPINVKFAADPKKYCKENPGLYPCTVISSRIDNEDREYHSIG